MLNMKLSALLSQKKSIIGQRWLHLLCDSYPPETSVFLKKEKNRFDNPMGSSLAQGIQGLLEALLQGMDPDRLRSSLDEVIRIRAIQDIPPSQAMAFIFLLKKVIREELKVELRQGHLAEELLELESRIDGLALLGFDVYTKRRETLHEIRVNEVKKRVSGLLRRTGMSFNNL
jgi:hypothetical protein